MVKKNDRVEGQILVITPRALLTEIGPSAFFVRGDNYDYPVEMFVSFFSPASKAQ